METGKSPDIIVELSTSQEIMGIAMSETRSRRFGGLQKTRVECKTCGVSDSFYSNISVEQFKLRHAGHEAVGGTAPVQAPPARAKEVSPSEDPAGPKAGTPVLRVMVSLEPASTLGQPVVGVRGLTEDAEEAFSAMMPFDEAAKANEILAKRQFDDYVTGRRYVWEESAVEYEPDAKEALSLPSIEPTDPATAEAERVTGTDASVAASTAEVERPEVSAPIPSPASSKAMQLVIPQKEEEDDERLLVSKSWYIHGVNGNREEAVRVSKVLKAFRWRVEPVYTVGVMLEDMLSIETSRNQISRALIDRVEGAGYRLSAVTVELGKPVAWFKRNEAGLPDVTAVEGASTPGVDESQLDLEPNLTEQQGS
jgi:hypothetical protein